MVWLLEADMLRAPLWRRRREKSLTLPGVGSCNHWALSSKGTD